MHATPRFARFGGGICYTLIAVFALLLLFSAPAPGVVADYENNENLSPTDDAHVESHDPNNNNGSSTILAIGPRTSPTGKYRSFIKFDLENVDNFAIARLWLYCTSNVGADIQVDVYSVDNDNWAEGTITWNNQPSLGTELDDETITAISTWYYWDVTAWVKDREGENMSLGLLSPAENSDTTDYDMFSSYDNTGNHPYLEIIYSPLTSITVDNPLVDRKLDYSGSGAELDTTITIRVRGRNEYEDISAVYISIRDNDDSVVVDNVQVTDNTVVDNTTLDFTYVYNPLDNLSDSALGGFDVNALVEDIWDNYENNDWGGDGENLFAVDDRYSSISFDPGSPNVGWELTVSGTHSRYVGSSSVTGSWLIDNYHGQFSLGASDSYSQEYAVAASFGDNVSVTIRSVDGVLDGVSSSSYIVSENVKFQVWVRFEENYGVVGWIPDENRGIDLLFEWDGGTYPYTLTANPENVIIPGAGESISIVKLTDNDDYWRYFIPSYSGGNINFIIVDDIADVEQYRFYLQDYTGQYSPPTGQISFKFWIGTDLADINSDYWGADWRSTAWLVTGTQYQVWVRGLSAPLRLVGPVDAVNPSEEKTIVVQVIVENVAPIFDYVYWNAWRIDNSTIRVEYQDNLDNTIEAHVAIHDENGVMQIEYQPDNEWFIVTWIAADGAESYEVVLTVQHGEYDDFVMTMPIGTLEGPPGVEGGVSSPWGLPVGMTIAGIGSIILVVVVGLAFDALRVQIGMLAMALTLIFTWQMRFLPLPGPYGGSFTATLILVMAVLFALTWRRGK